MNRRKGRLATASLCCVLWAWTAAAETSAAESLVLMDDFETDPQGWRFVGGEEFPGAKGAMTRDTTVAHGGRGSLKLTADFAGGGWSIDKTPSPSFLYVDYVRAYSK